MGLLAGRDPLAAAAPAPMEPRVVACEQGSCVAVELPGAIAALLAARDAGDLSRSRALTVRTEAAAAAEPQGPPLFGSTGLEGRRLLFRPRLPLLPGDSYRATFRPAALLRLAGADDQGTEPVEIRFRAPGEIPGAPEVIAVHPARESVPANLLRAYVHFSTPMRPDLAPRFVRLEDDTGAQVPLAFVEVPGGLWDPDHTRLTLLFHPGRIKRGVAPRRALGPPLVEGRRYRLRILPGWPSATGQPLAVEVGREWRVGPA
ncbi:MAG: hypothetical protein R3325_10235, partial [Thermoanaerobaculia bacterium]|nr:hypothetical protein [Thermoanaerobaculia bacterium]